jgi:hypothetical protein
VTEQAWGGRFDKPPTGKELHQALVGELASFLKAVEGLVGPKEAVGPASPPVGFGEGRKVQAEENLGRVLVKEDFEVRGVWVRGA